jgi:hypothetical protein
MLASAIAGGFLGTLVFSTLVKAASELALTRMDLALLLGTTVTDNRRKARAIGLRLSPRARHPLRAGVAEFFQIIGRHLVDRRARRRRPRRVHRHRRRQRAAADRPPRMATTETAANETTLIEPPGS